jgi:hypothetical protein
MPSQSQEDEEDREDVRGKIRSGQGNAGSWQLHVFKGMSIVRIDRRRYLYVLW